jgi:redox-sensitive bicupin YhaK (pirin superfamily)
MIELRPARERGHAEHGWLDSWHSFSFADYHDPRHMHFGALRVINEDRVAPGQGFGTHGHRDMEIVSYVLEGAVEHKDNMGNGSIIRPGDVQRMSAGTGVLHSEFNPSKLEPAHFLQIWIMPARQGIAPGYEQKHFDRQARRGCLRLVASPDGREGSVTIHQDATLHSGFFDAGQTARLGLAPGRRAYVHVARGRVCINGQTLVSGDAAKLTGEASVDISEGENAEVLVFDLA